MFGLNLGNLLARFELQRLLNDRFIEISVLQNLGYFISAPIL
jgi:hypothetical protein